MGGLFIMTVKGVPLARNNCLSFFRIRKGGKIHVSYDRRHQKNCSKRTVQKSSGLPRGICRQIHSGRGYENLKKASRHCYLLESASQTEVWGRYSFLGYEPTMEITCTDGLMKIRHTEVADKEETVKR